MPLIVQLAYQCCCCCCCCCCLVSSCTLVCRLDIPTSHAHMVQSRPHPPEIRPWICLIAAYMPPGDLVSTLTAGITREFMVCWGWHTMVFLRCTKFLITWLLDMQLWSQLIVHARHDIALVFSQDAKRIFPSVFPAVFLPYFINWPWLQVS